MVASRSGNLSTMKLLLENGADWRKTDGVSMIIIKLEFQSLMYVSSLCVYRYCNLCSVHVFVVPVYMYTGTVIYVQYMYFVVPVYMYTGTVISVQYMYFVVPVYMYTGTVISVQYMYYNMLSHVITAIFSTIQCFYV